MQEFPGARLAGQGTTGFVFAVEQNGMPRALKLRYDKIDFSTTLAVQDAMSSEVNVLNCLDHPSIVRTHGELRGSLPMSLVTLLPLENQVPHATSHTRARDTHMIGRASVGPFHACCWSVGDKEECDSPGAGLPPTLLIRWSRCNVG